MEGRPPEVTDLANGESLKLACMACIRGHRTKHCGTQNCRDKILWTIKRPGRPSNSCMCKFSGTARCKCVLAKAQCPHKPKKGEKRTVDCRCDERGRLCCTLSAAEWEMIARGERPRMRLHRNLEELYAGISHTSAPSILAGAGGMSHGQSPMSTPQTPAASVGGFTNGSGGNTPQTPLSVPHTSIGTASAASLPQSPAGPPRTRFGLMGLGAPMGNEDQVGQDVLAWQGHTPIAPAPRPVYPSPSAYSQPPDHISPAFPAPQDTSFGAPPYTFINSISQPQPFSPQSQQAHTHSQPRTALYQSQIPQSQITQPHIQPSFNTLPPVTASLNDLTETPQAALPALAAFDLDYFNFQFPGAICQQCGMADCTCRSCPTVLQNTMDGSWQQCCSRKHVHFGPATAVPQSGLSPKSSCCGSKSSMQTPSMPLGVSQLSVPQTITNMATAMSTRSPGGCCSGSNSQAADFSLDSFDFNTAPSAHAKFPSAAPQQPQIPAFTTPEPTKGLVYDPLQTTTHPSTPARHDPFAITSEPVPELDFKQDPMPATWTEPGDIDMDFDEFIQEMGCGCGTNCPCGMDDAGGGGLARGLDDSFEMEVEMEVGEGDPGGGGVPDGGGRKSCCGG